MAAERIIPLTMPPLAGLELEFDLKKYKLLQRGMPVRQSWGRYKVTDAAGKPVTIRLITPFMKHYSPVLVVNGKKHDLLPPFTLMQSFWIWMPLIAVTIVHFQLLIPMDSIWSGIRIFSLLMLGAIGRMLNAKLFRSGFNTFLRYFLAITVTIAAAGLHTLVTVNLSIAAGKIDMKEVRREAERKTTTIMLELLASDFNRKIAKQAATAHEPLTAEPVTVDGATIIFTYKSNMPIQAEISSPAAAEQIREKMRDNYCNVPALDFFRERGVIIKYRLENMSGHTLQDVSLELSTCPPASKQ